MDTKPKQEQLIQDKKEEKKPYKPIHELKTPGGYRLDEVVSSLQKCIRRGQEEQAIFWMYELVEGHFIAYLWRRLAVIVAEDIGLADPFAPVLVNSLAQLNDRANKKYFTEIFHPAMAIVYLCRAKKSREIDYITDYMDIKRKDGFKLDVAPEAIDEHTERGRELLKQMEGDYRKNADEMFYYRGGLLDKPVKIANDKYKKLVWKMRKLDPKKIDMKSL